MHLIDDERPLVFVVSGSRLLEVDRDLFAEIAAGDKEAMSLLRKATGNAPPPDMRVQADREPNAISLNLAQTCNLACSYCYADEGRFGSRPRLMQFEVAQNAIDNLLEYSSGRRVTIGFIGGEPFLNRPVMYRAVEYARASAAARGVTVGFSVATNGTLITPEDARFLGENAFAVSISIDGDSSLHDLARRDRSGAGSYAAAVSGTWTLLEHPSRARVAARATITRKDLRVTERIEALASIGFSEIGVSPLRTGPDQSLTLAPHDWPVFLGEMVRAADGEWQRMRAGQTARFSNLAVALRELHRGSSRPLPCGAGANYVSVSADGGYFTCHRTVNDPALKLGSIREGLSADSRADFLRSRHVDAQEPCRVCWARYLCGGGCHAEVIAAGRSGCDYIRGWLEHCMKIYTRSLSERPDFFEGTAAL
jgi:uncharacterized protein